MYRRILFFTLIILGLLLIFTSESALAAQDDACSGWAWSENVGWISFNNLNPGAEGDTAYGVNVETDGDVTGYAWGEYIGWIDFSPSGPYPDCPGCPNYSARYDSANNELDGWAQIVSMASVDKGWIKLRDSNYGVWIDVNGDFQDWAWSEDIGWISFNGANEPGGADYKVKVSIGDFILSENSELTTCSTVGLSWTISLGANGYGIWRAGVNVTPASYCQAYDTPPGCNPYTATNFTDTELEELTSYSYFIRAYNYIIFTDSNTIDVITPPCLPSQPRNLISTGECPDTIRLYWDSPVRPGISYNIYRKRATDASYPALPLGSTVNTFYEDNTIPAGAGYTWFNYKVVAVSESGVEGDPAETTEVACSECN